MIYYHFNSCSGFEFIVLLLLIPKNFWRVYSSASFMSAINKERQSLFQRGFVENNASVMGWCAVENE